MVQGIYGFKFGGHSVNLPATPLEGVASILVLLGIGIIVMVVLERYLNWSQAHR
jgi:energy-converting hydrogenase Eha subunit C